MPHGARYWIKTRGTLGIPVLTFSVHVQGEVVPDDLKKAIHEALSPSLKNVPWPALQLFYWNASSEDYVELHPNTPLGSNPLPEVLKDVPGTFNSPIFVGHSWTA